MNATMISVSSLLVESCTPVHVQVPDMSVLSYPSPLGLSHPPVLLCLLLLLLRGGSAGPAEHACRHSGAVR